MFGIKLSVRQRSTEEFANEEERMQCCNSKRAHSCSVSTFSGFSYRHFLDILVNMYKMLLVDCNCFALYKITLHSLLFLKPAVGLSYTFKNLLEGYSCLGGALQWLGVGLVIKRLLV